MLCRAHRGASPWNASNNSPTRCCTPQPNSKPSDSLRVSGSRGRVAHFARSARFVETAETDSARLEVVTKGIANDFGNWKSIGCGPLRQERLEFWIETYRLDAGGFLTKARASAIASAGDDLVNVESLFGLVCEVLDHIICDGAAGLGVAVDRLVHRPSNFW